VIVAECVQAARPVASDALICGVPRHCCAS
jgi:hypothetical protein